MSILVISFALLAADPTPETTEPPAPAATPPAAPQGDKFLVRGSLKVADVKAIITAGKPGVSKCYNTALQTTRVSGKIKLTWTIDATGAVKDMKVAESTTQVPDFDKCVGAEVASWKFPEPAGGGEVKVTYPFLFSSRVELLDIKKQ